MRYRGSRQESKADQTKERAFGGREQIGCPLKRRRILDKFTLLIHIVATSLTKKVREVHVTLHSSSQLLREAGLRGMPCFARNHFQLCYKPGENPLEAVTQPGSMISVLYAIIDS